MKSVAAIVVLYQPDPELLQRNLEAISGQVEKIYLIDNTPDSDISTGQTFPPNCDYIPLKRNTGIASAQNAGIRLALNEGYQFLYFLDQDSISPADVIERLTDTLSLLRERGIKTGAVGPLPVNRANGKPYVPIAPSAEGIEGLTEVREMISSGSLVPAEVIRQTGGMMEELFIDEVDHEWCWRAKAKGGYRFFLLNDVSLSHRLGGGDRKILWKTSATPSPFRIYHLYRNTLLLSRKDYVPLSYKVTNILKLSLKIFYYPIFVSPRLNYAANIFKGIRDGISGRRGSISK